LLPFPALLTVENDEFWTEDLSPVLFGALPCLQDAVTVLGYPIGGDSIAVTSGAVSRIEVTSYVHGDAELLGVQVKIHGSQLWDRIDCLFQCFSIIKDIRESGFKFFRLFTMCCKGVLQP
jgi:hypothetical protein